MAVNLDITEPIIIGNDHILRLSNVVNADGDLIDMAGWTVKYFLRKAAKDSTALLEKDGTLSGAFDPDPTLNTQVWTVTITDTETEVLKENAAAAYAWKRMDADFEDDLAYGAQPILRTASR